MATMMELRSQLEERRDLLWRKVEEEQRRVTSLEQESAQVRSVLSRVRTENGQTKDQLTAVKVRVKAREETLARGQEEEKITRTRINMIKAEAEKEKDRRFTDVSLYQSEVMKLCDQLRRQSSISGGSFAAVEEKKEALLKEIEQELAGFNQEDRQDDLVLEDWTGLLKAVEAVRKSFKMTEEEMKRKASVMTKDRSDKEFAFSHPVYNKEN